MTINEIIEKWYNSKEVNECISKMEPADLREDLKQEVFVEMLKPQYNQKVIEMEERGETKFFIVRIILNMIQSNSSAFYKKYRSFKEVAFSQLPEFMEASLSGIDDTENERIPKIFWDKRLKSAFVSAEFDDFETTEMKELTRMEFINECTEQIDKLHWYSKELILLYAKHGSIRKVAKEVDIPIMSVYDTIKNARATIKRGLKCQ